MRGSLIDWGMLLIHASKLVESLAGNSGLGIVVLNSSSIVNIDASTVHNTGQSSQGKQVVICILAYSPTFHTLKHYFNGNS